MKEKNLLVLLSFLLALVVVAAQCSSATPETATESEEAPAKSEEASTTTEDTSTTTEEAMEFDLGGKDVVVAVENAYPPFNNIDADSNEGVGWDYDAWREICSRLNCNPVFAEAAWDGIFEAMAAGEYDVLADGVTITAERDEVIDYSVPYVLYGQAMLVRADEDVISDADSLKAAADKIVGTQPGTTNEKIALDLVGEERILSFEDFPLAIEALKAGDVDVVFVDEVIAINYIIESGGALKTAGNVTEGEELAFVFPPGSDLIAAVDHALDEMKADGSLEALNNKWFKGEGMELAAAEETTTGEAMEGDLLSVSAPDCDYGGKIKDISALDSLTVQFTMCKPDPAFLAKAAFVPFFVQPREWIEETGGTGELLDHPVGTGPYQLDAWNRGDSIVFKRFDDYWGEPAIAETLVFRWATEGAARLLELQSGTVDHITKVSPDDFDTVQNDPNLQLLPVANPNILYLAMTNTFPPFDDVRVREAIAMGVDRQRIVDNFYPAGSEVASHFTPCSIGNACQGEAWYDFDPEAARALLAEAGFPDGFESTIYYRDVFRVYLPEPGLVAQEFQAQLKENLNIDIDVVVMESGEFIAESTAGNLDGFYLLGWGADYLHVTNFLDFHFSASNPQFGDPFPEIYEVLEEASTIGDESVAAPLYEQANNAIKELVPMVPIAHGAPADAALASVKNAHTAVLGPPDLWNVDPGKDTLVYMKAAEPISLYCGDETDGESLDACKMVTEGLYKYDRYGVAQPTLATSCTANDDSTVWTCNLRSGVKFHDGSDLDANDVVMSWAAGIDAANPYHVGNTGAYEYFSYLWDGLMNAE